MLQRLVNLCPVLALVASVLANGSDASAQAPPTVSPVIPGDVRLAEAKQSATSRGALLLGELNCLSCHRDQAVERQVLTRTAPDLSEVGRRVTPQFLLAYLADPQSVKPGSPMPNVFHASEPQARDGAVEALTHFLISLGGPMPQGQVEATDATVARGRKLFHTVGCVACHAPETAGKLIPPSSPSVPLGRLANKTTVEALTAFLLDPHKTRPSGQMPSLSLSQGEARAVAVYLLREQLENPQQKEAVQAESKPGLRFDYFEGEVKDLKPETIAGLGEPTFSGVIDQIEPAVPKARKLDYVLRFRAELTVPADGHYTFTLDSDDGSRLRIADQELIDNDGEHGQQKLRKAIDLKAGKVPFELLYFQHAGGRSLKLTWESNDIKRGPIPVTALTAVGGKRLIPLDGKPFVVDPQKAQLGGQMFGMLGCAACHTVAGHQPIRPYPSLAEIKLDSPQGCLGNAVRRGVPNYLLSDDQRSALKAALSARAELAKPLADGERAIRTMASLNCVACHRRGDVGGVPEDRMDYFVMTAEFDMGDEGRYPPALTGVGAKLRPEAVERIVHKNELRIRQVLATRMPVFAGASADAVTAALSAADKTEPPATQASFNEASARDGRQLFGVKGLGCVNCHGVLGVKSLGMPAPDLTTAHERLQSTWFSKLLHDPTSINPGTRMPAFWPGGVVVLKGVGGDTMDGQIAALFNYLSLGSSMQLPEGLAHQGGSELLVGDIPLLHRTFFSDVGPRTVLVGYPEQLNLAFDSNLVRLAALWRGRFFDPSGMWEGRGGNALEPLGTDVVRLPALPTFATLHSPGESWPTPKPDPATGDVARNAGGKFLGYELDAQKRPTFRYRQGDVTIAEQPVPKLQSGGVQLVRKFELEGKADDLSMLAAAGKSIRQSDSNTYVVDNALTVKLPDGVKPRVQDENGQQLLVFPVDLSAGKATFQVEMSW